MNLGPKADGTIDEIDRKIFLGIGSWLNINGEAIWGSERSPFSPQSWGHVTKKDNKLFMVVTNWPIDGIFEINGLKTLPQKAYLLSDRKTNFKIKSHSSEILHIIAQPNPHLDKYPVIVLEFDKKIKAKKNPILISSRIKKQRLHVFDGKITKGLKYGSGNPKDNYVFQLNSNEDFISWDIIVLEQSNFKLDIVYNADIGMGGIFKIDIGENTIIKEVLVEKIEDQRNKVYLPKNIGQITLKPGKHIIKLSACKITGNELMWPTALFFSLNYK